MPWDAGKYHSAHLPWEDHRAFRLAPNAESLDDVARRASRVFEEFVLPHVVATDDGDGARSQAQQQHHVVLVAHGIWLSEFLFAVKRAADPQCRFVKSPGTGYQNSAWARLEIELEPTMTSTTTTTTTTTTEEGGRGGDYDGIEAVPRAAATEELEVDERRRESEEEEADDDDDDARGRRRPPLPPQFAALLPTLAPVPEPRDSRLPPRLDLERQPPRRRIRYRVVAFNQTEHLVGLKRTKAGGVGSGEWDDKQRGLKEFFAGGGGGGTRPNPPTTTKGRDE
ncbi:hypothetical protein JCM11491_005681, partial [Sporobolomyces phaffii]